MRLLTNDECNAIRQEFARKERLERLSKLLANVNHWHKEYMKGRTAIQKAKDKRRRELLKENLYAEDGAAWKWGRYAAELDLLLQDGDVLKEMERIKQEKA